MLPLQVSLLVLSVGFAMGDAGIVVDTHVHRVARRLGWGRGGVVGGAGGGPEGTRRAMQALLPKEEWAEVTLLLVGFGQQTCTARAPKCAECPVAQRCPSSQAKPKPSEGSGLAAEMPRRASLDEGFHASLASSKYSAFIS